MAPELQPGSAQDGQDEQRDSLEQVVEVKLTLTHIELLLALIHWTLSDEKHGMDEEMVAAFQQLGTFFAMVSVNPGQFAPKAAVTSAPTQPLGDGREADLASWENEGGA